MKITFSGELQQIIEEDAKIGQTPEFVAGLVSQLMMAQAQTETQYPGALDCIDEVNFKLTEGEDGARDYMTIKVYFKKREDD